MFYCIMIFLGRLNVNHVAIVMTIWKANVGEEKEGQGRALDHAADVLDHVIAAPDPVNVKNIVVDVKY